MVKYNIEMLNDDETMNRLQLTISNDHQVLASLEGNEQHLRGEENQTVVDQVWQCMKNAWREMCQKTLGRKPKQHKAYASTDTLKKDRNQKEVRRC